MGAEYPQEWPGFEIIGDGWCLKDGAIVEGLGFQWGCPQSDGTSSSTHERTLSVRILDESFMQPDAIATASPALVEKARAVFGFLSLYVLPTAVRPLTQAAREMWLGCLEQEEPHDF